MKTEKKSYTWPEELIPVFPQFSQLKAHHQEVLSEVIAANHLYSDFNFISLWSWDHQEKLKISQLNDNLVVRFQDYIDPKSYFYSFYGTNMVDETAKEVLKLAAQEKKHELRLIPEFVIERLRHPLDFRITEDRDNHDYILAIRNMVELPGSHNRKKRNALKQFMRDNEHHLTIEELDIKSEKHQKAVRKIVNQWGEQVTADDSFNESELKAINKILNNHHAISTSNLHIIGISLGGELRGFSIGEILQHNFAMWHYKKFDRTVRHLGVALDNIFAKQLSEKGVTNINYEQDLGLEGLRRSKELSHPVHFLKKYTVSLAKPKK